MSSEVTIVMYHYVRDLQRSRYPALKALTLDRFRGQIAFFRKHYSVIRMEQLIAAIESNHDELPPRSLLLTFDDGYIDHYTNVLPILDEWGLQGSFFPSALPIVENRVLDVNKIHFILASVPDARMIVNFIFDQIDRRRRAFSLEPNEVYYRRLASDGRYDNPDVLFVKRILQRELPEALRSELTDQLFRRYVTQDESAFSAELYMSEEQLRFLIRAGMSLGSHGYAHQWWNAVDDAQQVRKLDASLKFLDRLGLDLRRWVMCYPYGGCNAHLLGLLKERGCVLGLSTEVAIADLTRDEPLLLPRLDTNDLPQQEDATLSLDP